jgi:hypothetical protein
MKVVDEAIKTLFDATTGLNAQPLYYRVRPEGAAPPYAIFFDGASALTEAFGKGYYEEMAYDIQCFHTDKDALGTMQELVHTTFDRASLTLSVGQFMSCQRINARMGVSDFHLYQTGELVYFSESRYLIRVNRTFA